MRYLLDTNTCIAYLTKRSAPVVEHIKGMRPVDLALCSIVKSELIYGAHKSAKVNENIEKLNAFFAAVHSLPFDDRAAEIAGEVRATLDRQGTPIGPNDLLIAAIAFANGLTLLTHNTKEFSRVNGLVIEDWEVPT
ncbi:MAG: type II toxin-antitoxin system VapC family toxin [Bradymonadales bacterium]|nr:type II toxin-antitoxin system VapC family toxin [Bradymonadales bacterium]